MPPRERDQMRRQLRTALLAQFSSASSIPPQLLGEWTSVSTSTVAFRDQATGSYAAPGGAGVSYRFTSDGRFPTDAFIQSTIGSCTSAAFITENGSVAVNGHSLILDSRGGEIDSKDNCVRSSNYRKSIPARQYVHTAWRIDRDQWGERLCMVADGKESCYRRK